MSAAHAELIERIRASAKAIEQAAAAVPAGKQTVAPAPGEWSVQQVVLHTRDAALLAFGLRIRRLLFETDPVFASYDEEAYRRLNPGTAERVEDIVQMLVAEHDLVARLLGSLPDEAWQRAGRHPESGTRTIEFFATRIAEHAEEHAQQIANIRLL
jgi:hypothetical protein